LTAQYEQRTGPDAIERLIGALQGWREDDSYPPSHMHATPDDVRVSKQRIYVYLGGEPHRHEGALRSLVRWLHSKWTREVWVSESTEAAQRGIERERALTALAVAALEQLRDDSARDLADLLDKSVEELEAERQEAARVEGVREPDDPSEILKVLPEEYREWFLADYRRALRAAYPAEGFLALQQMLRKWRLRAEQYSDPAYQKSVDEAKRPWPGGEPPRGWRSREEVRDSLRAQGRLASIPNAVIQLRLGLGRERWRGRDLGERQQISVNATSRL